MTGLGPRAVERSLPQRARKLTTHAVNRHVQNWGMGEKRVLHPTDIIRKLTGTGRTFQAENEPQAFPVKLWFLLCFTNLQPSSVTT